MNMTALPCETEFKLWLHPDDVEAFIKHPRLSRARPVRQSLHTLYFDTPDFQLARNKVALRVRRIGRQWVQTLKTEGDPAGGLSKRLELETPVSQAWPDFSRLPGKPLDKLIPAKCRDELKPLYETRFVRTAWNLRTPDGSRIEVALDRGNIIAGNRQLPICEVELELKSGSPDALFSLAELFAEQVPLIPFESSKATRGVQLASGLSQQPVKASPPKLGKKMTVCGGLAAILQSDLSQLQANLPAFLLESDPEYCHQARVAIRRFRSAVRLFRKDCAVPAELLQEITLLGNALGRLRDRDVFVLETLPRLKEELAAAQYTLLSRRANQHRNKQRELAMALVRSPRTGACLIALERWLSQRDSQSGQGRLGPYAVGKLELLYDRARKKAKNFAQRSAEERHALRIAAKRLRYAHEHFSSLLPKQKAFLANLAEMQDRLGVMNDVVVAKRLVTEFNNDGRLSPVLDDMERWAIRENNTILGLLSNCLQYFSRNRPIW